MKRVKNKWEGMEAEWEGKFLEKCGKQERGVRNENKGRIKLSSVCVFVCWQNRFMCN